MFQKCTSLSINNGDIPRKICNAITYRLYMRWQVMPTVRRNCRTRRAICATRSDNSDEFHDGSEVSSDSRGHLELHERYRKSSRMIWSTARILETIFMKHFRQIKNEVDRTRSSSTTAIAFFECGLGKAAASPYMYCPHYRKALEHESKKTQHTNIWAANSLSRR